MPACRPAGNLSSPSMPIAIRRRNPFADCPNGIRARKALVGLLRPMSSAALNPFPARGWIGENAIIYGGLAESRATEDGARKVARETKHCRKGTKLAWESRRRGRGRDRIAVVERTKVRYRVCSPVSACRHTSGHPNAKSLPYQDPPMPRSPRPSCRWSKSEGRCRAHPVSGTPNALPLETIGNRVKPYLRFFSRGALSRTFFRYPNRSSSLTSSTALPTCSRNRRKIDSRRTHDPKLSTP